MKARFGLLVVGLYLSIAGAALSQTYNSYADFSDTQGPVWYYMRCNTSGDGYTGSYGECGYVIDSPPYWGTWTYPFDGAVHYQTGGHTGARFDTVREFRVPAKMTTVRISGFFHSTGGACGDGIQADIRINAGYNPPPANVLFGPVTLWNGARADFDLTVPVQEGDLIRFWVYRIGDYGCDSFNFEATLKQPVGTVLAIR